MKRKTKSLLLLLAVVLVLSVGALSANTTSPTVPLASHAEMAAVGGSCGGALGVAAGLAVASLSPCSAICAAGAWYALCAAAFVC